MFIKRFSLLLFIICAVYNKGYGQANDFCNAVNVILRDAPNKFRDIKGRMTESGLYATIWVSGINVPGAITTRFVESHGLFYEGAFYQTRDKETLRAAYNKYKDLLSSCLLPQGFKMSLHDNFYPGLGDYKKVVFIQEPADELHADTVTAHISDTIPPHVAMEVDYSKESGKYTIVMFIFEH